LQGLPQLAVAQFFHRARGIRSNPSNLFLELSTFLCELIKLSLRKAFTGRLILPELHYIQSPLRHTFLPRYRNCMRFQCAIVAQPWQCLNRLPDIAPSRQAAASGFRFQPTALERAQFFCRQDEVAAMIRPLRLLSGLVLVTLCIIPAKIFSCVNIVENRFTSKRMPEPSQQRAMSTASLVSFGRVSSAVISLLPTCGSPKLLTCS